MPPTAYPKEHPMPNIELVPTSGPEAFAVVVDGDRVGTVAHADGEPTTWRFVSDRRSERESPERGLTVSRGYGPLPT